MVGPFIREMSDDTNEILKIRFTQSPHDVVNKTSNCVPCVPCEQSSYDTTTATSAKTSFKKRPHLNRGYPNSLTLPNAGEHS